MLFTYLVVVHSDRVRAETIKGPAVVVDGDTLRMGESEIRLLGIDAPELQQSCVQRDGTQWACGLLAAHMLDLMTQMGDVTCDWVERDAIGRALGICTNGIGIPINAWMVRGGMAWAYLTDTFVEEEQYARTIGAGVWSAQNLTAEEFRQLRR